MKKSLLISVALLLSAPALQAMPTFVKKALKTSQKVSSVKSECTDFNGKWHGTCEVKSEEFSGTLPISFDIANSNCMELVVDNRRFLIDGVNTEVQSSKLEKSSHSMTLNWNADKTVLNFNSSDLSRYPNSSETANIYQSMDAGHFKIEGGKLYLESHSKSDRVNDGKKKHGHSELKCALMQK